MNVSEASRGQRPDFKVARLALRGAAGRSATRPTKFGHYRIANKFASSSVFCYHEIHSECR